MKKIFTVLLFLATMAGFSQQVKISDIRPGKVGVQAFELLSDSDVIIDGLGGIFTDQSKVIVYYAWILDSESRELVWHQFDELRGRNYRDWYAMDEFNYKVELPKGNYELYFTGGFGNRWGTDDWDSGLASIEEIIEDLFKTKDREKFTWDTQDKLFVALNADHLKLGNIDKIIDEKMQQSVVQMIGVSDDEYREQGFNLQDKSSLIVYALGEADKNDEYDYCSIYNVLTGEKVFELKYRYSTSAGGADKNVLSREEITLDGGSYKVVYASDDSHAFNDWNALPPIDPYFYGVSIYPSSPKDKENISDYNPPKNIEPIAEITRVRDDEIRSMGISVKRDTDIRIYALGEGSDDRLSDYGWIVDSETMETVWQMKGYKTKHAGGADKNREISEVIRLEKGNYIVYYKTDGSHSFNDWNSSRPRDPEMWGITIWAVNEEDLGQIIKFDPDSFVLENVLVSILEVRDDEYSKKVFTLDSESKLRIIAVGEGSYDEMYDYGWIKDMDSGKVVWEMEYRNTDYAGGARKNRIANEVITLPKGEYKVYFETDGSHSFEDWNDDPPNNPNAYGIRILRVD